MKQFTEKEKEYFRKHINEFTLEEKSELINSNLKDSFNKDDLLYFCKYWEDKEIRINAFELWKFNKDDLTGICRCWKDKEIRLKAFGMWIFNKDDLINICKYWPDKEIRLKAKKLLNINLITKDNFITKL